MRTDWLQRHARYTPDAEALVWTPTGRALTYAQCHQQGDRLAAWLASEHDLEKGDRVAVLAKNTVEHVLLFIAAQKAGFILVPLNFRLARPELQYLVEDSDPAVLFFADDYAETAQALTTGAARQPLGAVRAAAEDEAAERPAPSAPLGLDDALMILYTSGTTGRPKGAVLTHGMLFFNSVNTEMRLDLTAQDASFNAAPF